MKKTNFIKHALVAATFALAVAVFAPATGSVDAQAAAKKVTAGTSFYKAKTVKSGTTTVTVKKCSKKQFHDSYVKYIAPKTGYYVFTLSDFKTKGVKASKDVATGYFSLYKNDGYGRDRQKVKTEGGKASFLSICTKAAAKDSFYKMLNAESKKADRHFVKRSATIKLKKGQTVWIHVFYTNYKQFSYKIRAVKK